MTWLMSEGARFRLIGIYETAAVVLDRDSGALTFYSPNGDRMWTDDSSLEDRLVDFLGTGKLGVSSEPQSSPGSMASSEPALVLTPQGDVVQVEDQGKGVTRVLAEQPDGTFVTLATTSDHTKVRVSGLPKGSTQPVLDVAADSLDWLSSPSATAGLIYSYSPDAPAAIWVLKQDAQSKTWTYEKKIVVEQGMRFGCISDDGSLLVHLGKDGATVEKVTTGESRIASTQIGRVSECYAGSNSYVLVERRISADRVRTQYEWVDASSGEVRKRDSIPAEAMISLSPEGDTLIVSYAGSVITTSESGETHKDSGLDGRIVRPGRLHLLNASGSISVVETQG